jgi:hypothetical protein
LKLLFSLRMNVQLLVLTLYLPFFGVEPATFGELNVYNSCFIHITKFSNNIASADLTSLLLKGQFSNRKFALFSIFNGTHRKPQIQPVGSIHEKCTLIVIVDFQPNDYKRLLYFMNVNKYTFISKPHSFYVLVVKANSIKIQPSTVIFPTTIFILQCVQWSGLGGSLVGHGSTSHTYTTARPTSQNRARLCWMDAGWLFSSEKTSSKAWTIIEGWNTSMRMTSSSVCPAAVTRSIFWRPV